MRVAVSVLLPFSLVWGALLLGPLSVVRSWGPYGHAISARAAVGALPSGMPRFFVEAVDQLAYLNGEPDRWRDAAESEQDPAMNAAHSVEHYLDLELVPQGALDSPDRNAFVRAAGDDPFPGLVSYRMLELFQRLRVEFRLWREETDPEVRGWIEQRIINDAGILGHYVTDVANPLHTTMHFDGWVGDNPDGYTADRGIHSRFESVYVAAYLELDDLTPLMDSPARIWDDPRQAFRLHIDESFRYVEPLYRLDRGVPFSETTDSARHRAFTAERLAAGALQLRDAWWTAWMTSAPE